MIKRREDFVDLDLCIMYGVRAARADFSASNGTDNND